MAREAYRPLYGDLTKLKDTSLLDDPAGGAGSDNELLQLMLAVSVAVDDYCNRHFYPLTATRTFDGPADVLLPLPDLLDVTVGRGVAAHVGAALAERSRDGVDRSLGGDRAGIDALRRQLRLDAAVEPTFETQLLGERHGFVEQGEGLVEIARPTSLEEHSRVVALRAR